MSLGNRHPNCTIKHEIEKYMYLYCIYICIYIVFILRAYFVFWPSVENFVEYCFCCCSAYCISVFIVCFLGVYQVQVDS